MTRLEQLRERVQLAECPRDHAQPGEPCDLPGRLVHTARVDHARVEGVITRSDCDWLVSYFSRLVRS